MGIDGLNEFPKVSKSGWFLMMDHVVFDPFCKTLIHLLKECSFTPLDAYCELSKLDKVCNSLMVLLHTESFRLSFGFSYGVIGTEVQFKFLDEKSEVR